MPVPTTSAPAPAIPTVTRYVGKCPICEGDFKLTTDAMPAVGRFGEGQKMVHHGYRRPGDGRGIVGDCYAVGHPAYEESCGVTREYREIIVAQRANVNAYLGRLRSGEVTEIVEMSWRRGEKSTTHKVGDIMWPRELSNEIHRTDSQLRTLDREIERLTALVDGWIARPLRTVEEFEAPVRAERDAAKAQRKADYEARTGAMLASYQKRLAVALRKKTVSTFAEIFETAPSKFGDRGMSRSQVFAELGHADVFAALGLDPTADHRQNYELTSSMRYGFNKTPWPESLG